MSEILWQNSEDCSNGFEIGENYYSPLYVMLGTAFIFFLVPALISLILYIFVFLKLRKMKTNVSRNRVLTVALFTSCVCWIVLWSISYFVRALSLSFSRSMEHTMKFLSCIFGSQYQTPFFFILLSLNYKSSIFPIFSSVMNPFCLLVVCKVFWTPVINCCNFLKQKIKKVCTYILRNCRR